MKLSAKSRYAIIAMLDIAVQHSHNLLTLSVMSGSQGISTSYMEQLFAKLRNAELIEGVRGPGGGYRLGRPTDKISIAQIILAVDAPRVKSQHSETENCKTNEQFLTHCLWKDLSFRLNEFLNGITLATLIDTAEDKRISIPRNSTSSQINRMFQPAD